MGGQAAGKAVGLERQPVESGQVRDDVDGSGEMVVAEIKVF